MRESDAIIAVTLPPSMPWATVGFTTGGGVYLALGRDADGTDHADGTMSRTQANALIRALSEAVGRAELGA